MIKFSLFTCLLFVFSIGFSQPELGKKSKIFPIVHEKSNLNVKPLAENPTSKSPFSSPEPLKNTEPLFTPGTNVFDEKKKPSFVIGENRDEILKPKTFINPNLDILEKLNGKTSKPISDDFALIRGNQDLGNFKINSKFVNVRYRDFGEVDGDLIRVYLNGRVIENTISLNSFFQGLEILLEKGFNKIDFEAINQGTSGPNTAEFQVFDDNKKLVSTNQWNLVTGFKATIMITKE